MEARLDSALEEFPRLDFPGPELQSFPCESVDAAREIAEPELADGGGGNYVESVLKQC